MSASNFVVPVNVDSVNSKDNYVEHAKIIETNLISAYTVVLDKSGMYDEGNKIYMMEQIQILNVKQQQVYHILECMKLGIPIDGTVLKQLNSFVYTPA